MKSLFIIFSLIAITAFTQTPVQQFDVLDTLAHRFLFKSDPARRAYINSLVNDPRLIQLAFGLKRRGLYDTIRQYLHPIIQQIVLYNSYTFYISVGRTFPGGLADQLYDWPLTALRYQDSDIRDGSSTYANVHSPTWGGKRWTLVPSMSTFGGMAFSFVYGPEDFVGYDNVDQTGWTLSAIRRLSTDRRNVVSTNVMIRANPAQSNLWNLIPVFGGESFVIQMNRDDLKLDNIDQTGWYLDVGNDRPKGDDPEDVGKYVMVSKNQPAYTWNVRFCG